MNRLGFLSGGADYKDIQNTYVDFTMEQQLLKTELWDAFVRVYGIEDDKADDGWRGEYWGKTMRGACLTYMYNRDEKLYAVLENAVKGLLSKQRADGSFSTYGESNLLWQWDIWCRKYVLTGMLHFYRICKDETLKEEILTAMTAHANALINGLGSEDGKKHITETSSFWGGVNSCSVLEPILDLYKLTKDKALLKFAEYIISSGGCSGGDLIALAYENKVMPYEYPEVKAYETISFFEGLLAYYEITGKEYYFTAVKSFTDAVNETDITAIGCCGCTHELFDHSRVKQTEYSEGIMQETCVTVTWMRMNARLYMLTGEEKYFARLEKAALNALYGAVNINGEKGLDLGRKVLCDPMPFDSYSPLFYNRRGRGIGGKKDFSFGGYYGCCACIASAGIALVPLTAVMKTEKGFVFSSYINGKIDSDGFAANISTDFPRSLKTRIKIKADGEFSLKLRVPDYAENISLTVNGAAVNAAPANGFISLEKVFAAGDIIALNGDFSLRKEELNGRQAFFFGPLTLALDEAKNNYFTEREFSFSGDYTLCAPENGEMLRLKMRTTDGEEMIFTDYASCGKKWNAKKNRVTVWM